MHETSLSHEQQKPSLQEHFKDTVLPEYGVTLGQLIDLCPVPPDQRDHAAMEEVAAKVLQSSQIEIPEQFSHLVTEQPEATLNQESSAPKQSIQEIIKDHRQTAKPEIINKQPEQDIQPILEIRQPTHQELDAIMHQQNEQYITDSAPEDKLTNASAIKAVAVEEPRPIERKATKKLMKIDNRSALIGAWIIGL